MSVLHPRFGKGGSITGGLWVKPPAANEFLRFSHEKTLILAHFLIEKEHAVMQSLWTSGGARNFERGGWP